MNILDSIKTRRSVREFKDQEIPESAIDVLIEALRWAPSRLSQEDCVKILP